MDKKTFSSYGWVTCVVVVLAIMIALAGPLGNFITGGVNSIMKDSNSTMMGSLPPKMFDGANAVYNPDEATEPLSFRSSAPMEKLVAVKVDGAEVASSNYTVTEGSTIVTFTNGYIATLSEGKHALDIVSENGTASTSFFVDYGELVTPWEALVDSGAVVVTDGVVSLGTVLPDNLPEKNEYGFYYGVQYKANDGRVLVFRNDTSFDMGYEGDLSTLPSDLISYSSAGIDMSVI